MPGLVKALELEEKDKETVRTLGLLYGDSKAKRKDIADKWDKHLDWLKGKQEIKDRPASKTNSVTNFLFSEMMTIVPILTSNVPTVSVKGQKDGLVVAGSDVEWGEVGDTLGRLINQIFARNYIVERSGELVTHGLSFGKAYFKSVWDKSLYDGHGDVRISVPDTRSIFLEPGKILLEDMNYVFEVTSVDELTLLRKHRELRDRISLLFDKQKRSGQDQPATIGKSPDDVMKNANAPGSSALTSSMGAIWDMGAKDKDRKDYVDLIEAWFHDDEMVEESVAILDKRGEKVPDRRTGNDKTEQKMRSKFPNGRLVQFAGNIIFRDQKNKFPGFPYVEFWNYQIPGMQYGMSELDQTVAIQEQYNIRNNQLYDLLNYNLGPLRIHDASANLDPDLYTNAPNLLLEVGNVNGFKQIDPPNVGRGAFESLEKIKREIETVFGVREVTQGSIPGDIRSGTAIEALQEAADVRLRMKSRSLEATFKRLAKFLINMISEFYIPGVHYDEKYKVIKRLHADMFDVEIRAGVNLPRSRVGQQEAMFRMFSEGIVDEQYIIEHSQLEDKEALVDRMRPLWEAKRQALENQIQQAMNQPGAEGQPAGPQVARG